MLSTISFALYLLTYFLALWLGLYLLGRDATKRPLLLTSLGLLSYAAALLVEVLHNSAPAETSLWLEHAGRALVYLPSLFWSGMLASLLPENYPRRDPVNKLWQRVILPLSLLIVLAHSFYALPPAALVAAVGLPLAAAFILVIVTRQTAEEKSPLGLPMLATIFFGLAVGLALPLAWLPRDLVVLAIGVDLLCLGLGIAILDAFEEGHRLAEDMLRSGLTAMLAALIFGVQVALYIALAEKMNFGMVVLMFSTVGTAVILTTLASPTQQFFDHLNFLRQPANSQEKSQLRAAAGALDRLNPGIDFSQISEKEFQRLTRRAISYLGDLPRLASSPLTHLPLVSDRLRKKEVRADALARAHELKALLTESIQRLKPPGNEPFGTTDAWRYYNALHFPYVVGLKPASRYQPTETLAEHEIQALEWFRSQVPERTLHNWQSTAARLVTADLQDRLAHKQNQLS